MVDGQQPTTVRAMPDPLDVSIATLPPPDSEATLEDHLSRPTRDTVETMARLTGDLLVLGAGGKLGLSLCRLARRSLDRAGNQRRVIAVSRFSGRDSTALFHEAGIETIAADLLDQNALSALPDTPNVVFLGGMKFGATGAPGQTWALNTLMPGLVARRFARSRIVALSTGNVYAFSDVRSGGAVETDPPAPVGEYAQSCLGRERLFQYFSERHGTPVALIRLNYANDLRYGVVLDVAQKVAAGQPIDVTMGYVNVIWQGDANAVVLRALDHCASPPTILNVSGPETIAVRWLATELARLLDMPAPAFTGAEAPTALLSNCSRYHALFGYPTMPLGQLLAWTAQWVRQGGRTLNKPTRFEARDGQF